MMSKFPSLVDCYQMSVSYSYLHVPQEETDYRQVSLHTGQKEIRNENPYRAAYSTVLISYT
jgi:hypothetical protein